MRLVFCRSNPIDPDPRVEKEARCLQSHGHQVSVVGWDRSNVLPEQETAGGIQIYRRKIKAGYAHGMLNIFPLLRWQFSLLSWLIKHADQYDAIHACDFDTILPALLCKRIFNKKLVYDIFDFYADHLRATPSFIKNLIRVIDLWVIDQVDAVILVDSARLEQIAGTSPVRLAIIYNTPEDSLNLIQVRNQQHEPAFRIAYIGLLQVERGLLDLISVMQKHPDWYLNLAGFGGDEKVILDEADQLSNIKWHGRVHYQDALNMEAAADVLIALYDPSIINHRYASPNKVFEAMMLAKPVIAARNTNVDILVECSKSGIVVEYGNVDELEDALQRLAADNALRKELGTNARRAYEKEYNWEIMKLRLLELYDQL